MVVCNGVASTVSVVSQVSACSLLPNSARGIVNGHKTNDTLRYDPQNHFFSVIIFENTIERNV